MTIFIINGLKFDCETNAINCPKAPKSCRECVLTRLRKLGFIIESDLNILSIDEKFLQTEREKTWQRFLDVLNIKHIILMDKESGVALLNYPVSAVDIDAGLLSGFIQANITFSESSKDLNISSDIIAENLFYEFQYQNFNILLKNGDYIRLCMILDQKASEYTKRSVSRFLLEFEGDFEEKLKVFQETGEFESKNIGEYIIRSFNIALVFPMTLAHAIPPGFSEEIDNNSIKKAVFNLAHEFISSKKFFYINSLLNELINILKIDAHVLLYEIYQLYENKVIVPISLETVANNIQILQQTIERKAKENEPISSIVLSDTDMNTLKEQMKMMNGEAAKKLIKDLIKKGRDVEKVSTFEVAQKEYKKALIVAEGFELKDDVKKLSEIIFEAGKKAKQVELDFAIQAAENAERNSDNINAIYNYQKAVKILRYFQIYNGADNRIKKIKKKIIDLREAL
jgi:hypothetical protein